MALDIVLEGCVLWPRTGNITHILGLKQTEPSNRARMSHMNAAPSPLYRQCLSLTSSASLPSVNYPVPLPAH